MRSMNRKRALVVSGAVILLCMTVIVGMTWALFTDTKPVFNHLQAGDLEIKLERIGLRKNMLDGDGYLGPVTYKPEEAYMNFSDPKNNDENVFDIKSGEKIVPYSEYTADMKISNESDVAFEYWLEIVVTDGPIDPATGTAIVSDQVLAEQLDVTVTMKDKNGETKTLYEGVYIGNETAPFDVLAIGDNQEFTVTVTFANYDADVNNKAQTKQVYFDLIVHARQYTGANPNANP